MNIKGKKKKNQVVTANIFEQQKSGKNGGDKGNLKASTWHQLETRGKFYKNDKLTFIK